MFGTAIILGGLLALGWSELVNIWSGTADGPAARATFLAAACTLVAVVVAQSRSPAFFLVAVAGSVCGALLLGAGGEVRIVAVAAAVAAALTLGSIEQSRRNWTAPPRRGFALVLLPLLVGAVAAGVVLLQVQHDPGQPRALGSGLAYPGIKPPWTDPLGMTRKLDEPAHGTSEIASQEAPTCSNPRPTTHERAATKVSAPVAKKRSAPPRNTRRCSESGRTCSSRSCSLLSRSRYVSSPFASPGSGSVGDWQSARLRSRSSGRGHGCGYGSRRAGFRCPRPPRPMWSPRAEQHPTSRPAYARRYRRSRPRRRPLRSRTGRRSGLPRSRRRGVPPTGRRRRRVSS